MPSSLKKFREEWIRRHELYLDSGGRVYTPVQLGGETLIMDATTGQLYRDGACLTSSRLTLGELRRDQEGAAKKLRSIFGDKNVLP